MRRGCDPVEVERLARRFAALAGHARGTRSLLARADRRGWTGPGARRTWDSLAQLSTRLGGAAAELDLLARRLRSNAAAQRLASLGDPGVTVLRSSAVGDGRWVARTGSPGADVLVVLVPGVGTELADRAELARDARRVWEHLAVEADRARADVNAVGQDRVAVVSWLGYDPPDDLLGGLARAPASRGGATLAADVAAWRRGGADRVVVVGHSYGALVSAQAAAAGMAPDELVMLGAPGLGVADPAHLALGPGAQLWAAAADGDAVALLARAGVVHGPDPLPEALALPTSRAGHGAYLEDPVLLDALTRLALHDRGTAGTVARTAR